MEKDKSTVRKKADEIKPYRCKNLIAVLEYPTDVIASNKPLKNLVVFSQ